MWAGDVVSKHRDPTDANYLLRPNSGEITTTTGYYKTPDIADIQLNETYHIAMVYDGDSLKFYRNGCLMSEIKATGDLIQNSWETSIGYYLRKCIETKISSVTLMKLGFGTLPGHKPRFRLT